MYKLKTSSSWIDDLSIGSDRNRLRGQQELRSNKNANGKNRITILLTDVFGFEERHEKVNGGLGYKLTLTAEKWDAVLNKTEPIAGARIKTDDIH